MRVYECHRFLAQYFQSRPSAAGSGYDAGASSGSNWGPENPDLISAIETRQASISELDEVPVTDIPADAVTASASGLDPHISAANALLHLGSHMEAEQFAFLNASEEGRAARARFAQRKKS